MFLVLMGLVVVFVSSLDSNDMISARDPVLGAFLVVLGAFLDSVTYVVLDTMLEPSGAHGGVEGLEGIGWMGYYGCFIQATVLIAMFFIPGNDMCLHGNLHGNPGHCLATVVCGASSAGSCGSATRGLGHGFPVNWGSYYKDSRRQHLDGDGIFSNGSCVDSLLAPRMAALVSGPGVWIYFNSCR